MNTSVVPFDQLSREIPRTLLSNFEGLYAILRRSTSELMAKLLLIVGPKRLWRLWLVIPFCLKETKEPGRRISRGCTME